MKDLNKDLHIITLDVPYPPDYGGMIDSYYRIQSLHNIGIQIHLHCFEYGRHHSPELESLCKTVNYYLKKAVLSPHLSLLPYIVSSRNSKLLLDNLCKEDFPVLFDGLHTTFYLDHPSLSTRKKFVRMHNIEHKYFINLSGYEKDPLKKLYFKIESLRLRQYEKILAKADKILSVCAGDDEYFKNKYHNSELIPPFHAYNKIESQPGSGEYCLYHGNLSVSENIAAVEFLISNVFSQIQYPCIIAGKNPAKSLATKSSSFRNIRIVANPDINSMSELIRNAHINVLPSNTRSGFKMKILGSLSLGKHCLVNEKMIVGTGLESLCHVSNSGESMIENINTIMHQPFTDEMIAARESIIFRYYNNVTNATKLASIIFPSS